MNKSPETWCVCHHPKSDHAQDSHGNTHCRGLKPGVQIKQTMSYSEDALCDCKKYRE